MNTKGESNNHYKNYPKLYFYPLAGLNITFYAIYYNYYIWYIQLIIGIFTSLFILSLAKIHNISMKRSRDGKKPGFIYPLKDFILPLGLSNPIGLILAVIGHILIFKLVLFLLLIVFFVRLMSIAIFAN